MAKQKGLHKIIGTIGDATYSKTIDGYSVKEKSEISKSKFQSAASMARTRENAAEFGRAGQAGKLFRLVVRNLLKFAKDSRVTGRLTGEMMKVLKADSVSVRGLRNVMDGETELLKGFEFNINATMSMTFPVFTTAAIDRAAGILAVTVPAHAPITDIIFPDGATHYKLVSAGAAIDFENKTFEYAETNSEMISLKEMNVPVTNLVNNLTPAGTKPLFLLFGIQFYQFVNNLMYPLKNGAYNSLIIIEVNGL